MSFRHLDDITEAVFIFLLLLCLCEVWLCRLQNITRAFKIWVNSKWVSYPFRQALWLLVLLLFHVRVGSAKTQRRTSNLSESCFWEVRNSLWRSKLPTDAQPWRSAQLLFWNPFKTQKHSSDHTHSVQIALASASNFLSGTKCFYYPAGSDYIDPCVCPLRSERVFFFLTAGLLSVFVQSSQTQTRSWKRFGRLSLCCRRHTVKLWSTSWRT